MTEQAPTAPPSVLAEAANRKEVWQSISVAIGAELRPDRVVTGASGLDHPVQAIAVDERLGRVILVSADANPRLAALMQSDVQATMPEVRVIVARPAIVDVGMLVESILRPLGPPVVKWEDTSRVLSVFNA